MTSLTTDLRTVEVEHQPVDMETTLAVAARNACKVCGGEIFVMTYKGTGVCCGLHEQVAKEQLTIEQVNEIIAGTTREDGIK